MTRHVDKALHDLLVNNIQSLEKVRAAMMEDAKTPPASAPAQYSKGIPATSITINLRYVLIPVFCTLTGYSDKAVRRKIADGKWIEGRHYRKAPDGHITMNLQAYYRWVEDGK